MKRLFMTAALLSVVVATALFAQSDNQEQEQERTKARLLEERNQVEELQVKIELQKAQAKASKAKADHAEEEAVEAAAKREKAKKKVGHDPLERKLVELHRRITDLRRAARRILERLLRGLVVGAGETEEVSQSHKLFKSILSNG